MIEAPAPNMGSKAASSSRRDWAQGRPGNAGLTGESTGTGVTGEAVSCSGGDAGILVDSGDGTPSVSMATSPAAFPSTMSPLLTGDSVTPHPVAWLECADRTLQKWPALIAETLSKCRGGCQHSGVGGEEGGLEGEEGVEEFDGEERSWKMVSKTLSSNRESSSGKMGRSKPLHDLTG